VGLLEPSHKVAKRVAPADLVRSAQPMGRHAAMRPKAIAVGVVDDEAEVPDLPVRPRPWKACRQLSVGCCICHCHCCSRLRNKRGRWWYCLCISIRSGLISGVHTTAASAALAVGIRGVLRGRLERSSRSDLNMLCTLAENSLLRQQGFNFSKKWSMVFFFVSASRPGCVNRAHKYG